jgi:hypothetical protein
MTRSSKKNTYKNTSQAQAKARCAAYMNTGVFAAPPAIITQAFQTENYKFLYT